MLTVQIVIPCFTERRWFCTLEAIRSAQEQTYESEVVVVVDHNQSLLARLKTEVASEVTVVSNRFTKGASGARNTGVLAGTADLIAFLDDDAIAEPTWIEHLVHGLKQQPSAVGAGGAVVPVWETSCPRWYPREFSWVIGGTPARPAGDLSLVRNVWSCNMIVRRQCFDQAGAFRTGFGKVDGSPEPEDTELCLRMALLTPDASWLFIPNAAVRHVVPAERATWSYFVNRCWAEGRGKAALASVADGGVRTLTDEAVFVGNVLSRGLYFNFVAAIGGDVFGLGRAAAIIAGVFSAGMGFAVTVASRRSRHVLARFRSSTVAVGGPSIPGVLPSKPLAAGLLDSVAGRTRCENER